MTSATPSLHKLRSLNREYTEALVAIRLLRDVGVPPSPTLDNELDALHESFLEARDGYLDKLVAASSDPADPETRAVLGQVLTGSLLAHRRLLMGSRFRSLLTDAMPA